MSRRPAAPSIVSRFPSIASQHCAVEQPALTPPRTTRSDVIQVFENMVLPSHRGMAYNRRRRLECWAKCLRLHMHLYSCRRKFAPDVNATNVANGANTEGCNCVVERGKRVGVGWRFALLRRSDSCLRLKSAPLDDDRRKTRKGLVKPMVRKCGKCGCPFAECFGIGSSYSELPQSTATSLAYEME